MNGTSVCLTDWSYSMSESSLSDKWRNTQPNPTHHYSLGSVLFGLLSLERSHHMSLEPCHVQIGLSTIHWLSLVTYISLSDTTLHRTNEPINQSTNQPTSRLIRNMNCSTFDSSTFPPDRLIEWQTNLRCQMHLYVSRLSPNNPNTCTIQKYTLGTHSHYKQHTHLPSLP